ncbi:MAG: beta-ketoacyl-[acyl-carrier-protein] synthase family protein [Thermoanaerobaculia bacterium]|nr:beta-ketoacyl-[acyl-carrier-protein] synthase family protein [Thermoanaerobaculia bacterium]
MKVVDRATRIAVTGIGIYCSIGRNRDEVWDSLVEMKDGIRELSRFPGETFPTSRAAEVEEEIETVSEVSRRELRRLSRSDRLAIIAVKEALEQARGTGGELGLEDAVVSTGTSTGGLLEGEDYFFRRRERGHRRIPVAKVLQQPTSGPSDAVARTFGCGGGVVSNATACASGGAAIGLAMDLIRSGRARVGIAGGTDALCRLTYSGFNVLQAVDSDPCRPFDETRQGITLGEGAGYLVLERWDDALERGAEILAEVVGYGATCDAHHPTAPIEDGTGAAAAMQAAIEECAEDVKVDYVNAHGTGTTLNDPAESLAIRAVLGDSVPVSSSKSYFGHTLGAAGGLEAVVTILALVNQKAPPTLRLSRPGEGCELDFVRSSARPLAIENALSNTFGFGGSNVSLLIRRARPNGH